MSPAPDRRFFIRLPLYRSLVCLPLVLLAVAGCGASLEEAIPSGWTLAGRASAVLPALEQLQEIEQTPIARGAAELQRRIQGCELFVARCPRAEDSEGDRELGGETTVCRLAETAECVDALPDEVAALGAGSGWVFSYQAPASLWFVARGSRGDDGALTVAADVGPVGESGALSLVLPAAEAPGPPRLSDKGALLHARVRPDGGLNIARFVSGGGWAARMYRLKSDLFEGKALAGVWELAAYVPKEGEIIPPLALAIDVRDPDLAVTAMERFLSELEATWPVRRADYRLGDRTGACLSDARVLPDLTPCYVADGEALFVGWNPRSLDLALSGGSPGEVADPAGSESGGRIFFARFPDADEVIARASGALAPAPATSYPWAEARISGVRDGDAYRFGLVLTPR